MSKICKISNIFRMMNQTEEVGLKLFCKLFPQSRDGTRVVQKAHHWRSGVITHVITTEQLSTWWKENCVSLTGLKASLERLQLDYIDVVFANRPDPNTPIEGVCTSGSQLTTVKLTYFNLYWRISPRSRTIKHWKRHSGILCLFLCLFKANR